MATTVGDSSVFCSRLLLDSLEKSLKAGLLFRALGEEGVFEFGAETSIASPGGPLLLFVLVTSGNVVAV